MKAYRETHPISKKHSLSSDLLIELQHNLLMLQRITKELHADIANPTFTSSRRDICGRWLKAFDKALQSLQKVDLVILRVYDPNFGKVPSPSGLFLSETSTVGFLQDKGYFEGWQRESQDLIARIQRLAPYDDLSLLPDGHGRDNLAELSDSLEASATSLRNLIAEHWKIGDK